jgi:hypothetical protein
MARDYPTDLSLMSNKKLFDETIKMAGGDSWEGDYTAEGEIYYDLLLREIRFRLKWWLNA